MFIAYNINYLYIFEASPSKKMTYWQLWKVGAWLLSILAAALTLTTMQVKLDYYFTAVPGAWFVFGLACFMAIFCF